jgi:L-lactate dehydrogenase complex protein LldG
MTARDEILARIGAALGSTRAVPEVPRDYRHTGEHPAGSVQLLELLTDRLVDYKATVHHTTSADLPATLESTLDGTGALLVPVGIPGTWAPSATVDDSFDAARLDTFDTVLTTCAAAAAETGTIVLDGSSGQGRRAVSLVPDRHICVVRADQVVQTVPELLARLDPRRPLTFISGPSATSDIELQRVEGVHGPRTLIVILVD